MTDDQPLTLDDILKMNDDGNNINDKQPGQSTKPRSASKAKADSKLTSPSANKDFKSQEEILVEVKNLPAKVKVSENEKQRILERYCSSCNHIFLLKFPWNIFT